MPIRPENRARYPADWPAISQGVRERAHQRCEGSPAFPDCRAPNRALGYWRGGVFERMPNSMRYAGVQKGDTVACSDGTSVRIIQIVLTVGHLDHTPENCDPNNLRAWCQRCHLHYDRDHHAQTRCEIRKAGKAAGDLFPGAQNDR